MAIRLQDFLATLPPERQAEIQKRTEELLAEYATLRQVREARQRSQEAIAKKLNVNQAAVSKLERRTDMYVSTLRKLIKAMGGELDIIARFPDRPPIHITQFRHLDDGLETEAQSPKPEPVDETAS